MLVQVKNTMINFYFVRSGYVNPGDILGYAGNYGYYWSGQAYSSNGAYSLYFRSCYVDPSNGNGYRYNSFSVRCVAGWE